VTELEIRLAELAAHVELPPDPDLEARVLARIAAPRSRRRLRARIVAAVALALLAVVAAAFAVPQSRGAILRFFGVGAVRVEVVEEVPPVSRRAPLALGERVSLEEARRRAAFDVLVPRALGEPDAVYFRPFPPGGAVSLRYGDADRPRVLVMELAGTVREFIRKLVGTATPVEPVVVRGTAGWWIAGAHAFFYADRDGAFQRELVRLAAPVLLWERGGVTYRIEAGIPSARAVEIAESLEP
jgi:hypothetical protein